MSKKNSNDVGKLGLILDDKQVHRTCCVSLFVFDLFRSAQIEVKTAQPRGQRDQQRLGGHVATTPNTSFNNGQVAAGNATPMGSSMSFMSMNNPGAGDMSMMYQRMMGGMGTPYCAMTGGGMGMMGGFNPMMGMGMGGMGRFGMGGMGGVGAMNPMATAAGNMGGVGGANMGMGGAGGVGAMRLGMGPIGMTGAGAAGMGGMVAAGGAAGMGAAAGAAGAAGMGMGMGMRQGMGMMGGVGRARPGMNQGPGPARVTNRGQHGFHPYAR